ncbi:MAG TPA: VOC family protein [Caulobacteraceae bacterium]|jgi:catechol 2,3-dioxygenase-like lactoylglutathione lyase family enzyme
MPPPYQAKGLDHVVLRIADLTRALDFYREVVGCAVEREAAEIGLTQLRVGRSLIDLVTLDGVLGRMGGAGPAAEGRNVDHFAVAVAPFDEEAIRAHLGAHGVEIVGAGSRYGAEGEGPSIYIKDPDGNTVELKGPPSAP